MIRILLFFSCENLIESENLPHRKPLVEKAKISYETLTSGLRQESMLFNEKIMNDWDNAFTIDERSVAIPIIDLSITHRNEKIERDSYLVLEFNQKDELIETEIVHIINSDLVRNNVSSLLRDRKSSEVVKSFNGAILFQDVFRRGNANGIVYNQGKAVGKGALFSSYPTNSSKYRIANTCMEVWYVIYDDYTGDIIHEQYLDTVCSGENQNPNPNENGGGTAIYDTKCNSFSFTQTSGNWQESGVNKIYLQIFRTYAPNTLVFVDNLVVGFPNTYSPNIPHPASLAAERAAELLIWQD